MPPPPILVARAYAAGLLPRRLAAVIFWRLATRENVSEFTLTHTLRFGQRQLRLQLPLKHVGNWTLLFGVAMRTSDGPMLRQFVRSAQTSRCIIDVGANVGLYSYFAVGLAPPDCRIIAVEANPTLAEMLLRNVNTNQLRNLSVVGAAVSDRAGETEFHLGELDLVSSVDARHVASYGGSTGSVVVPSITLDGLVAEKALAPDLVKIDVEGHERAALAGAEKTLGCHRPSVLIEATNENAEEVHDTLTALGYRGRRFDQDDLVPFDDVLVPPGHPFANFLYEHPRR